jgi:hypothetical protein
MILGALAKHQKLLRSEMTYVPEERLRVVFLLARRIGRKVPRSDFIKEMISPFHISLTNSSSFMYSRSDGGRAAEVQHEFTLWANHVPTEETQRKHVLGSLFTEKPGLARWKTVILEPISEKEMSLNFGDPLPGGALLETRKAGFNKNLGYQLLQCAADAGIKRGVLDKDYNVIDYPYMRATVSSEPGGKARIVTANEWWVTILLQPLGHLLVYLLQTIPQARAGLFASEPAWEWAEDLRKSSKNFDEKLYHSMGLLTSDLSEATDHCHRKISRAVLEGFLEGVGANWRTGYFQLAISLLVSKRWLVTRTPP